MITADVPMTSTPDEALDGVRLAMIANDWSLRHLIPDELAKSFGFFQSKPATAFSPVAVTLDELGDAWKDGKIAEARPQIRRRLPSPGVFLSMLVAASF